jgi:hypothetical protein
MHRQQFPGYKLKPAVKRPRLAKKELPSESEHDVRCANLASSMMPELLSETWVQDASEGWAAAAEPLRGSLVPVGLHFAKESSAVANPEF